mgnify:CR=1 FL=1
MLALVITLSLYVIYTRHVESFEDQGDYMPVDQVQPVSSKKTIPSKKKINQPATPNSDVIPYSGDSSTMDLANPQAANIDIGTSCGGKGAQFISSNLLPKDDPKLDPSFAEFSPAAIKGQNFIDSNKYAIGTQSQSLRNANLQLRSEPANPQTMVCPWSQSTIAPDKSRPNLEIGTGSCA